MSDISSYSISNTKQIFNNLTLLFKNNSLISARFGSKNESFITALLNIDEKNNLLILDCGPNEDLNRRMLNAGKIAFATVYNGIKVSFAGAELKEISYKGEPAFTMPIPKSIYWMENREYFRIKLSLSTADYCQLILGGKSVKLKLYDISISGFSMLTGSPEVADLLLPGASFEQCKLMLGEEDGDGVLISFTICTKYVINPDKIQKIHKLGCKFNKLPLPVDYAIQRYIQRVQREQLQKDSGLVTEAPLLEIVRK